MGNLQGISTVSLGEKEQICEAEPWFLYWTLMKNFLLFLSLRMPKIIAGVTNKDESGNMNLYSKLQ